MQREQIQDGSEDEVIILNCILWSGVWVYGMDLFCSG